MAAFVALGAWSLRPLDRVHRVLVGNVVKPTEAGGVRVTVATEAGAVSVEVADTGVGVQAVCRPHLFEPFG